MNSRTLFIIAGLCFAGATALALGPLARMRAAAGGTSAGEAIAAVQPGEFAGTLMLGGFRGLACDLMWLRADRAKESGRLYESVALSQAIVRVQPRFEQIWEYLAWDQAYNLANETEDPDAKWGWFLAGLTTNAQGCLRNPDSDRLLRHLAWMFHHRGDVFRERVRSARWAALVNPVLAAANARLPESQRLPLLGDNDSGIGNYRLSERLYLAAMRLNDATNGHMPVVARDLWAHAIERDGNQMRNRGEHRAALARYLEALRAWDAVRTWCMAPALDAADAGRRELHRDIAEQNQGRLRRKTAMMGLSLANDHALGERFADAVDAGRWDEAATLAAGPGWRSVATVVRGKWADE